MNDSADSKSLVEMGRDALRIEARAVAALVDRLGADFEKACRTLLACSGRTRCRKSVTLGSALRSLHP